MSVPRLYTQIGAPRCTVLYCAGNQEMGTDSLLPWHHPWTNNDQLRPVWREPDRLKNECSFPNIPRIFLVVRRPGAIPRERADERAILDARDIGGIGAGIVTSRPQLLIQLDERAARDHFGIQPVAFFFGPIHPMNRGGLGQLRHLVHPSQQVLVLAQRNCMVSMFHKDARTIIVRGAPHDFLSCC